MVPLPCSNVCTLGGNVCFPWKHSGVAGVISLSIVVGEGEKSRGRSALFCGLGSYPWAE